MSRGGGRRDSGESRNRDSYRSWLHRMVGLDLHPADPDAARVDGYLPGSGPPLNSAAHNNGRKSADNRLFVFHILPNVV